MNPELLDDLDTGEAMDAYSAYADMGYSAPDAPIPESPKPWAFRPDPAFFFRPPARLCGVLGRPLGNLCLDCGGCVDAPTARVLAVAKEPKRVDLGSAIRTSRGLVQADGPSSTVRNSQ